MTKGCSLCKTSKQENDQDLGYYIVNTSEFEE